MVWARLSLCCFSFHHRKNVRWDSSNFSEMEKKDDRQISCVWVWAPIYRICCTCLRFEFLYIETHAILPGNTQAYQINGLNSLILTTSNDMRELILHQLIWAFPPVMHKGLVLKCMLVNVSAKSLPREVICNLRICSELCSPRDQLADVFFLGGMLHAMNLFK